jgi:hypothetical protein
MDPGLDRFRRTRFVITLRFAERPPGNALQKPGGIKRQERAISSSGG